MRGFAQGLAFRSTALLGSLVSHVEGNAVVELEKPRFSCASLPDQAVRNLPFSPSEVPNCSNSSLIHAPPATGTTGIYRLGILPCQVYGTADGLSSSVWRRFHMVSGPPPPDIHTHTHTHESFNMCFIKVVKIVCVSDGIAASRWPCWFCWF